MIIVHRIRNRGTGNYFRGYLYDGRFDVRVWTADKVQAHKFDPDKFPDSSPEEIAEAARLTAARFCATYNDDNMFFVETTEEQEEPELETVP